MNISKNSIILFTSLTVAAFVLTFAGCQTKEEVLPLPNDLPIVQADEECVVGTEQYFELEEIDPILNGLEASYAFVLTTEHSFQLSECACAISRYEIDFASLPEEFTVEDQDRNNIPFTVEGDLPLTRRTVVIDPDVMYDSASEIHFLFENAPALEDAGGLCVIDNFGGIDRTTPIDAITIHNEPAKVSYQLNFSIWIHDLIIPTSMTRPY